ncbi:hypothetical protein LV476_02120 [Guyparkeria hydrothermalis]|uniref:hypothetical protein n=1 Tax=Guyparkeria hydrothermalis TaxID=923 RepID=UPI002021A55A|nr:hypothetical protein [Guyparkeria hydrothermalis]MCL7743748.1 hypothetical protein [Guyparkeria hydrothermalis]
MSPRATSPHLLSTRVLVATGIALAGLLYAMPSPAQSTDKTEAFDWDAEWEAAEERAREEQRLIEKARQVNEGELEFLTDSPPDDAARMEKRLVLDRQSLDSGWADMNQCHYHLDPAPAVEIVYNPDRTRDIRITRRQGVGQARVEGPSVQMREIERGASICVAARVLALTPDPQTEGYLLENGPFMRRFLDGYYPMRVTLTVDWPERMLEVVCSEPPAQPGLTLETHDSGLRLEAYFEGRLTSRLHLVSGAAPTGNPETGTD